MVNFTKESVLVIVKNPCGSKIAKIEAESGLHIQNRAAVVRLPRRLVHNIRQYNTNPGWVFFGASSVSAGQTVDDEKVFFEKKQKPFLRTTKSILELFLSAS